MHSRLLLVAVGVGLTGPAAAAPSVVDAPFPGGRFEAIQKNELREADVWCEAKTNALECSVLTVSIKRAPDGVCWANHDRRRHQLTRVGDAWWRAIDESPICPNLVTSIELRFEKSKGWTYSTRTVETAAQRSEEDCRLGEETWLMSRAEGRATLTCTQVRFGYPPAPSLAR